MRWALPVLLLLVIPAAAEPHEPIRIVSDNDFLALGAAGSGTLDDPYILEDLDIERRLVELTPVTTAVHIQGTRAHAILRSISAIDSFDVGIRILDATNITLASVRLEAQGRALWLDNVRDVQVAGLTLDGGTARDGTSGLVVTESQRVVLRDIAVADGNGPGVQISTSRFVRVEGMTVTNHQAGIRVQSSQDVDLLGVTAQQNRGDGVWISNVTRVGVYGMDLVGQIGVSGLNSGRGLVAWDSEGDLFAINAQGNDGAGITIYNAALNLQTGHALDNGGAGVHLELAQARLGDFEIHGNNGYGLELFAPPGGQGFADIQRLHIHNNKAGLYAENLRGLNANDLRVEQNDGAGMALQSIGNVSLLNSVVSENRGHGFYAKDAGGQLAQNQFDGNGDHGVMLESAHRFSIVQNQADGNGGSGLYLQGGPFKVDDNRARNNGAFGVELGAATNATLQGNAVAGNGLGDLGEGVRQKDVPFPMAWVLLGLVAVLHQRTKSV